MKVLMINVVCGIRSTGRICTDLATALEEQGHEVKIAYGREAVPDEFQKYAVRIGSDFDVKLHGLKARLFDGCGFGSKKATKNFIKWVKEFNPDVIHLHNIHGYYINIEVLFDYLRTCGKKIIWTLHDCWAFTGHCSHFSATGCDKWKTGCDICKQKRAYPKSYFDCSKENWLRKKKLFSGLTNLTIVTPSLWLKDIVNMSFLNQYRCECIPNGVDLELFKHNENSFKEKYLIEEKKIILGCASTWSKNKGIDFFIELSKIISEEFVIVLVGLSKRQMKYIPRNVVCIERTNSIEELVDIYSSSYVYINASLEETMGLTTVEAMACGTPVIVSDKTALPEVVDSNSGIVVSDFTPERVMMEILHLRKEQYDPRSSAIHYEKFTQYKKYLNLYFENIIA